MLVEKVLTSGGDTSVGEVETYSVGIRSMMAYQESEPNKAELRALQQQQEELRAVDEKTTRGNEGASWSGSE